MGKKQMGKYGSYYTSQEHKVKAINKEDDLHIMDPPII